MSWTHSADHNKLPAFVYREGGPLKLQQATELSCVLSSSPASRIYWFLMSTPSQARQKQVSQAVPWKTQMLGVHSTLVFPPKGEPASWAFPPKCELC